jgi:peptide/nickel transport system substrate-binding protein
MRHLISPRGLVGLATLIVLLAACAPAARPPTESQPAALGSSGQPSAAPRGHLRIAWAGEPPTLSPKMGSPGGSAFNELAITFNSALTYADPTGQIVPQIAREVPSIENGSWVVNPDGTMVTTYRLRQNARWHDSAPLTSHDFAFAYRVYVNPEVPIYRRHPEPYMSSVEALDDHTLVINWSQPYYRANGLRYTMLDPLPRHILEDAYKQDVQAFVNGPFWTDNYVGSGPFKVSRWEPGIAIYGRAHEDWVLGPPRAATIEVRFIADANTILANLLAGELDISAHPWFPPQLAAQMRDRWDGAGIGYTAVSESRMEHLDLRQNEVPGWQPALTDPRIRQALLSAIDREGLVELLNFGLGGSVADMFLLRNDPIFPEVDRAIVKYPYDPNRAARLFADAGWRRASGDGPLVNAAGQTLNLEARATGGPAGEQHTAFLASNWKAVGVDASTYLVPRVQAGNPELNASFPGGLTSNRPITPDNFSWTSSLIPTAQNRWLGQNRGSFSDPEVDRFNEAVLTATSPRAWLDANIGLHRRMSETLGTLPLFYPADVIVARHPITGPAGHFSYPCYSWNIWEWGFPS